MKSLLPLLLCFVVLLQSCLTIKRNADTFIIDNVKSSKLVCNQKEDIYLLYRWDYWFHDLKKEQTLNWNDDFIKSIRWDKHKKELLFVGQTVIEPYNTSMGIIYRNAKADELVKEVKWGMREKLLAENLVLEEKTVGMYTYTILTYQLRNDNLRAYARYREYYCNINNDVMRIVFWSMESANHWEEVIQEGERIMIERSPVEPPHDNSGKS